MWKLTKITNYFLTQNGVIIKCKKGKMTSTPIYGSVDAWKIIDVVYIVFLLVVGVMFAALSYEMDRRDDEKMAAMLKPVNNSDISFLRK